MIKPIETHYKGYRFRSRLEARWAVFFDTLGVQWVYEPEGFELGDGVRYLPDFWLPQQECWVEIKGAKPSEKEMDKMIALKEATGKDGFIFYGQLALPDDNVYPWAPPAYDPDWPYHWCECPQCGQLGIQFDGRSDRLPCKESYDGTEPGCTRTGGNRDKGYNYDSPRLIRAYTRAISARFEHGECG